MVENRPQRRGKSGATEKPFPDDRQYQVETTALHLAKANFIHVKSTTNLFIQLPTPIFTTKPVQLLYLHRLQPQYSKEHRTHSSTPEV